MAEETEIKYRLTGQAEHGRLRAALAAMGAQGPALRREDDSLFDTPAGDLRARGAVLRLRVINGGPRGKLTYKGPARFSGPIKARQEEEVAVLDAARAEALLEALGYQPVLRYSKQREAWRLGRVEVALDALDIGFFCEVEGPADEITGLSRRLGLSDEHVERRSYPELVVAARG